MRVRTRGVMVLVVIVLGLLTLAYLLDDEALWPVPFYDPMPGGPVGTP